MIELVANLYITTMPVILGGIFNMVFTKTSFYRSHKKPIDNYIVLKDGQRLFGENKTWVGFFSMIILCVVFQVIWSIFCYSSGLESYNDLYLYHANLFEYNVLCGLLYGLFYMLFELPNSFIKRRLNIIPGKTKTDGVGKFFFVIDQLDSMFGVMLVPLIFAHIGGLKYFVYVVIGGFTHVFINLILYKVKIRRNP